MTGSDQRRPSLGAWAAERAPAAMAEKPVSPGIASSHPRFSPISLRRLLPPRLLGFTLVEVLVALAIVAVALAAGLRASGALVLHAERQSEQFLAQLCAENELVRLRLSRQLPDIGRLDFDCQQGGQSLTGQLLVSATPNPNFRRIEARVISQDRRPLLSLVTVMGRS